MNAEIDVTKVILETERTLPFIDAGISGYEEWVYFSQVNKAKKEFAEESEYNFYFNTIQAGLHTDQEPYGNPDGAHYDSDSEVQLGHLFADIFEQFLEPVEKLSLSSL